MTQNWLGLFMYKMTQYRSQYLRWMTASCVATLGAAFALPSLAQEYSADTEVTATEKQAQARKELETEAGNNPLAITAYHRNYVLPWTYNSRPNQQAFHEITDESRADRAEVSFQISLKVLLADDLFGNNGDLYFAYSQKSWWQAYNEDASSPFRETNYEPEAFMSFANNLTIFGWTNTINRIGLAHQSNGRSDPLSRSWNRVYADFIFQRGDWAFSIAPHIRISEDEEDDDNPDLQDYIGHGTLTLVRAIGEHEVAMQLKGNPSHSHYGAQLDYSFPLFGKVRGFVQYYNGYGESMIDYDHDVQRLGLGFSVNTYLAGMPNTD